MPKLYEKSFNDLYKEVIEKNLCHLCGACIAACIYGALEARKESIYRLELKELEVTPGIYKSIEELCQHCGFCYYNCPYNVLDIDEMESKIFGKVAKNVLGVYKRIIAARAKDRDIRENAQQGGATTAILKLLLEKNYVKGVIVAMQHEIDAWKPIPTVVVDPKDLIKSQKTKYTPSPQLVGVREAVLSWKLMNVAIVGTPCELQGLYAMKLSEYGVLKMFDSVRFKIGTFCFGTYSYKDLFLDFLMKKHGIPPSSITRIDLDTHKLKVYVHGELKLEVDRKVLNDFIRGSCKICHDFTAKLSDISVGGIGSPEGWTTIIIRSELGERIVEEAEKEGYIETMELTEKDINKIVELAKLKKELGADIKF
ncbi:MAG: Coenzyme F420 hydrogenase/dehydrogenase, beta subunit C-terminal domain [Candidatus Njordarchaeia archaeon]